MDGGGGGGGRGGEMGWSEGSGRGGGSGLMGWSGGKGGLITGWMGGSEGESDCGCGVSIEEGGGGADWTTGRKEGLSAGIS